jgi:methionyl-tRNA formyltransferase
MKVGIVGGRTFAVEVLKRCLLEPRIFVHGVWPEEAKLRDFATFQGLPIWEGPEQVKQARVDLLLSVHNHTFISTDVINSASVGVIGYHPSLLPLHRGIDAVRWTIEHGDKVAGGSTYWLDGGIDTGPVLLQDWCHVRPEWGASGLWREALFPMGLRLVEATLELVRLHIEKNGRKPAGTPQDKDLATFQPPFDERSRDG